MPGRDLGRENIAKSNASKVDFSVSKMLQSGGVPPSLLGEIKHGGSIFSNIAHRAETAKRFENLANNGVDDQVFFTVKGKDGKDPVKTPFFMNGKHYYPNENGEIRIVNGANVKLAVEIREYQEKKTDEIMRMCVLGDDIASFILGITPKAWLDMCSSGGTPPGVKAGEKDKPTKVGEWPWELAHEDCTISNIESLVDSSISQTRALSKLRKIVKMYLNNVNLDDFDTVAEKKADMDKGMNYVESTKDAAAAAAKPAGA